MLTELVTPPSFEPVTLQQAKLQCRVWHEDEDMLLLGVIIPGARDQCEQLLRRSIMLTTWRATFDAFPGSRGGIAVRWPNLQQVVSIEYRDTSEQWQTIAGGSYTFLGGAASEIRPIAGVSWPQVSAEPGSVRVTYKSGYAQGDEDEQHAAVPPSIRHWMLLRIATAYAHRQELMQGTSQVADLPGRWADSLLDRERIWDYR